MTSALLSSLTVRQKHPQFRYVTADTISGTSDSAETDCFYRRSQNKFRFRVFLF